MIKTITSYCNKYTGMLVNMTKLSPETIEKQLEEIAKEIGCMNKEQDCDDERT